MVLGPHQIKMLRWPYKFPHGQGFLWRDCIPLKDARCFLKGDVSGQLRVIFQNLTNGPVHLTPKMRCMLFSTDIHELEGPNGEVVPIRELLGARPHHQICSQFLDSPLDALVRQFPRVFDLSPEAMIITDAMLPMAIGKMDIEWLAPVPSSSRCAYQPMSLCLTSAVDALIDHLIHQGILEQMRPEDKGFFSQAMFIPKKDPSKVRLVVDFRRLNSLSNTWTSALPPTHHVVAHVPPSWRYFSVFDVENGFYNIPLQSDIKHHFCFEFHGRRLRFNRLPQGWNSSACIFHSLLASVLHGTVAINYMDDIIVGGCTLAAHDAAVVQVLQQLDRYGFHLNRTKAQFRLPSVEYLGCTISGSTYGVDDYVRKLQASLPEVTGVKSLRSALGCLNVLRRFTPHLASLLAPFYKFTEGGGHHDWLHINSLFQSLWAQVLGHQFQLSRLSASSAYHLYTDWSQTGGGFGYVLFASSAPAVPLWLGSRRSTQWKCQTSSFLGELDAIVWAVKQTTFITQGQKLIVFTDSQSSWKKLQNSESWIHEDDGRVLRLLGFLLGNFVLGDDLEFRFIPRDENKFADLLSKWPRDQGDVKNGTKRRKRIQIRALRSISRHTWQRAHRGHFGVRKTFENLRLMGFQTTIQEVRKRLQCCRPCQMFRRLAPSDPLGHLPDPSTPGELIGLDFIGPLRRARGNVRYILVIVDHLTRWCEAIPFRASNAINVIKGLEKWKSRCGVPKSVVCDNASYCHSNRLQAWCVEHKVNMVMTAPYSHKSNGMVERANQTLIGRIRRLLAERGSRDWPVVITTALGAMNTTPHGLTQMTPESAWSAGATEWKRIRERMADVRARVHARFQHKLTSRKYSIGDRVWLYDHIRAQRLDDKFAPFWTGPWKLHQRLSRSLWRVQREDGVRVTTAHSDFLQPYF